MLLWKRRVRIPEVRRRACEVTGWSCSYSMASSGCRGCMRAPQPGAGAPQLSMRGPPVTRALPPPPRGAGRGPGGCLRCLASCSPNKKPVLGLEQCWHSPEPAASPCARTTWNVIHLTSSFRFSLPFFLPQTKFSKEILYPLCKWRASIICQK